MRVLAGTGLAAPGAVLSLEFVEVEHSTGFHARQAAARIVSESIDFSRQGQIMLRDGTAGSRLLNPDPLLNARRTASVAPGGDDEK
jgi:hypothetical protein